jgi:hypothetical protein
MEIIGSVSRVLAGQYFRRNAAAAAGHSSVLVEQNWVDFHIDAIAVLKTLRAPPSEAKSEQEKARWIDIIEKALRTTEEGNE